MATESIPRHFSAVIETLSAEDFETASIRSAAPSYISDAPSYHSTVPYAEPIPAYSPPAGGATANARATTPRAVAAAAASSTASILTAHPRADSVPSPLPSEARTGLPPVPTGPIRRHSDVPNLAQFRIPSWSTINSNPTYQRVAHRRAAAASSAHIEGIKRIVLTRVEEEERNRFRPLEDPYLVGEEAAARARRERLARENFGVLMNEDRRWDWFLSQANEREEPRIWKPVSSRGRLARTSGPRFS